jgi:type IV pilus assembly protein PilM
MYYISMGIMKGVGEFFALDIGTNAIRVVELSGDVKSGWSLKHFAYTPVDRTVTQDNSEAGRAKLGEAIKTAVEQSGVKTKNVALGIPAAKAFTTVIEVPNQPLEELVKVVRYQADQYIPMAIDDAQMDWAPLGINPGDPSKQDVLLASTAMDYAEVRTEAIEQLGLNVVALEPDSVSIARSLMPVGATDARLVLDMGESSTDMAIVFGGALRLVRAVPGGLAGLARSVAASLNVDDNQARQFILKFGLAQDKLEGHVFQALSPVLEGFATELTKSIKFYENKYPNVHVGGISLSGYAGVIPFISEYVEAKTGVATAQGNPWQLVRVTPEQQQVLAPVAMEFAVVIGLAERENAV